MKRSIARAWAAALDSGEYKQGQGQLRKGDKFCTLGILCNLHAQAHPGIAAKQKHNGKYLGETYKLPLEVIGWAGMNSNFGYITWDKNITMMNDSQSKSFAEIAKVVRKFWKQL